MAKKQHPVHDIYAVVASLLVLAIIVVAVWMFSLSFSKTLYVEAKHEVSLKQPPRPSPQRESPSESPYDSGVGML